VDRERFVVAPHRAQLMGDCPLRGRTAAASPRASHAGAPSRNTERTRVVAAFVIDPADVVVERSEPPFCTRILGRSVTRRASTFHDSRSAAQRYRACARRRWQEISPAARLPQRLAEQRHRALGLPRGIEHAAPLEQIADRQPWRASAKRGQNLIERRVCRRESVLQPLGAGDLGHQLQPRGGVDRQCDEFGAEPRLRCGGVVEVPPPVERCGVEQRFRRGSSHEGSGDECRDRDGSRGRRDRGLHRPARARVAAGPRARRARARASAAATAA
jgi:hypothetical protein